ncbi:MAG: ABC transporter substrate-binding protein [Deltaproteobacteria bacterium]|nr:ABC transporter substrate-binding protein [Deltaproteobacteria bacterium]
MSDLKEITIYHSPDADDAFMFYGFESGAVDIPGFKFEHALNDIESLNQLAIKKELEVTAVSIHAYAYINDAYALLPCGASMGGEDYGPRLVCNSERSLTDGSIKTIATPGELTSALLAMMIYMQENNIEAEIVNMDFDQIQHAVKDGTVDAGVVIHEGQITTEKDGLVVILDLGKWWWQETGLPLPLGINVIRKDMGNESILAVRKALQISIEYGLANRKEAIDYAMQFGRGLSHQEADTFIEMYVNDLTCDIGDKGKESIKLFLDKAFKYGLIPSEVNPEFID